MAFVLKKSGPNPTKIPESAALLVRPRPKASGQRCKYSKRSQQTHQICIETTQVEIEPGARGIRRRKILILHRQTIKHFVQFFQRFESGSEIQFVLGPKSGPRYETFLCLKGTNVLRIRHLGVTRFHIVLQFYYARSESSQKID